MNQLQAVVEAYRRLRAEGRGLALATVFTGVGSVCRRPGSRMLVSTSGETVGCIGAGCMERDVAERARRAIASGRLVVARYDANPETDIVWGLGLGCGGVTEVLIEPLSTDADAEQIAFIADCLERNEPGAIATAVFPKGSASLPVCARIFLANGKASGSIEDPVLADALTRDAAEALRDQRRPRVVEYQALEQIVPALIEVIPRRISLVIFGADQDAVPLAHFAGELGWRVTVVDSRVGLATAARFPTAESVVVCPAERAADSVRLEEQSAAVIMMHQYVWDMELLRRVLSAPLRYVGVLGPRERTEGLLRHLGSTATGQARGRLYAPVGLDIGAETSEEIAFAIVAEIQAVLAGRAGGSLRDHPGPIHARPEESSCHAAKTPPTG